MKLTLVLNSNLNQQEVVRFDLGDSEITIQDELLFNSIVSFIKDTCNYALEIDTTK